MNLGPKTNEINKAVRVAKIDLKDKYSKTLKGPKESEKRLKSSNRISTFSVYLQYIP